MPPRKSPPKTGAILSPVDAAIFQEKYGEGNVRLKWGGDERPWNRPQVKVLTSLADEMLAAGGKGGGKSEVARAWLVSGNPHLPDTDEDGNRIPWNASYADHPGYHGLILRRNEDDLQEFIGKAAEMYSPIGGEYINKQFRFPSSGAIIDCGHMKDKTSWTKYLGQELVRIVIDEAALIPDFESYEQLRSCLRTTYPELRRQILLTSNANGPGVSWLTERFMNARKPNGEFYQPGELIEEEYEDPDTGEKFVQSRIWIFSTYRDNPAVIKTGYGRQLVTITDDKMRRAYLDGDWNALFGSYFSDIFRDASERGIRQGEPQNANHVYHAKDIEIKPWWHRSISMDWGYAHDSAILWACQSPDGRVIIYRELAADKTSPELLGYEIGMRSRDELRASSNKSMVLHLSHDAFHNDRGERTIAELIAAGIARVLGRDAVHIPDMEITRLKDAWATEPVRWDQTVAQQKAIDGIKLQRRLGITIRMAQKTGPIGWMHCRELMRWKSIGLRNTQYDPAYAATLSPEQQFEYVQTFRMLKPEALPRLQIIREECPKLIAAIPKAQHEDGTENIDKKHFSGKDLIDSLHYLVMGLRDEIPAEPFEAFQERQMLDIAGQYGGALTLNDKIHINRALEQQWKDKSKPVAPYTPPRHARSARLMRQGILKPTDGLQGKG